MDNIFSTLNTVIRNLENKKFYRLADQANNIMVKIAQSKTDLIAQWNTIGYNFMKKDPNFIKPRKAPGVLNTYDDATSKSVVEYLVRKDKKIKASEFTPYQELAKELIEHSKMNKLITLAMVSEELDKNNLILESNKVMHAMMKLSQKETDSCPAATQNIKLNLKNRQKAIDEYGYGPADPSQPNNKFWKEKMDMWKVDKLSEVKNMLCGNCAAFDQTTKTLDCIEKGIGEEAEETINAGKLGYCKFLKFKCASKRTCDAWVTGGPIRDKD